MTQGRAFITIIFLLGCSIACQVTFTQNQQPNPATVYLLNLSGPIGPAAHAYFMKGLDQAKQANAQMIILQLDTPGGLERTMRSMVTEIIRSPKPIITYVAPSGARAASAGTFILYASHIAAMAPGTNIGAATPISLASGGANNKTSGLSAEKIKAMNDASAYIRSLAQLRHRNVVWAEQAVTKGSSLSAEEALQLKVIDLLASNYNELLAKINGRTISLQGNMVKLDTANVSLKQFAPDWRTRFLAMITDPNIAYILLLLGIYGLLFELLSPGFILPGVAGLISLLIALYAFQLLPINYAALALMLVGMAFIFAEAFVPSFGALGVGGIIAFIIGSVMLFDNQVPGFTLLWSVIIAVTIVTAGFLILIVQLVLRAQRKPIVSGREQLMGSIGKVILMQGDEGLPRIRIRGELWQVRSNVPLKEDQLVKVTGIDELILIVEPIMDLQKEGNRQ